MFSGHSFYAVFCLLLFIFRLMFALRRNRRIHAVALIIPANRKKTNTILPRRLCYVNCRLTVRSSVSPLRSCSVSNRLNGSNSNRFSHRRLLQSAIAVGVWLPRFAACLRQPSLPVSERVDLSNFRPIHQRVIETKKQTKNNMQLKHHNTIDMQDYKAVTCV